MTLLPIPVLDHDAHHVQATTQRAQTDEANTHTVARVEKGFRIGCGKCKSRDDTADIAKADLPSGAHSTSMVSSEVHRVPAHDDGHRRVRAARDHEEGAVLDVVVVVDAYQDGESGDRDTDGDQREEESVPEFVREKCHKHAEPERRGPGWYRVQLCLDVAVSVGLDDSRGEISVAVGWDNQSKVHQTAEVDLEVLETGDNVFESNGLFQCRVPLVILQPGFYEGALLLGEPLRVLLLWS